MARLQHGTASFLSTVCCNTSLIIMAAFLVTTALAVPYPCNTRVTGAPLTTHSFSCTNSCTLIWGSPAARPTLVDFGAAVHGWVGYNGFTEEEMFDTTHSWENLDFYAYNADYHMDKVNQVIKWAECIAHDWPELDLKWCLADWHDGKLIRDSVYVIAPSPDFTLLDHGSLGGPDTSALALQDPDFGYLPSLR